MKTSVLLWSGLVLAVVASFVLLAYVEGGARHGPASLSPQPLYRVRNVTLTRWNARGLVRYRLDARRLVRWKTVEDLTEVRFHYHPGRTATTLVHARYGQRASGRRRLLLWKHVRVFSWRSAHAPPLLLRTHRLWINTRSELVHTRAPVTISEGRSRVRGVGLRARLTAHRLRLLARVHAVLYPHAPASSASVSPPPARRSRARPARHARGAPDTRPESPGQGPRPARDDVGRRPSGTHQLEHHDAHASSAKRQDGRRPQHLSGPRRSSSGADHHLG
ncbi:MAG: LPS export ABC transporter periplasmic protein LptC [Gammaproteobacteria bacterium]|nr:LPS export ABC transporter periplasmic protein LptC [Gammaproteobacteria bacterium]